MGLDVVALVRKQDRRWWWIAGASLALFIATLVGLHPAVVLVTALAAVTWALIPRWGLAAALGIATCGGAAVILAALIIAPAIPGPFGTETSLAAVVSIVIAGRRILADRAAGIRADLQVSKATVAAAAAGPLIWVASVILGALLKSSGGLSWAVYSDSSRDVWFMRLFRAFEGVPTFGRFDMWPIEHAISTAFLPVGHPANAEANTFMTEIVSHSISWTVLIAVALLLAALAGATFAQGGTSPRWAPATVAGVISIVALAMPVHGFLLRAGQINAHMILILMFTTVLVSIKASERPVSVAGALLCLTTLTALVWVPFAVVPGLLFVILAWRHRADIRANQLESLLRIGLGVVASLWAIAAFATTQLVDIWDSRGDEDGGFLKIPSSQPNPVSFPVSIGLVVLGLLLAWHVRRTRRAFAEVAAVTILGELGVALALGVLTGGFAVYTEYYIAKFISLGSLVVFPLVFGLGASLLGASAVPERIAAFATMAGAAATIAMAPTPAVTPRWDYAPRQVITGEYFGERAQFMDKVAAYADDEVVRLAWRADPPFDYIVNWLLVVNEPDNPLQWNSNLRAHVRNNWRDHSTYRACQIAIDEERPVVLYTRDEAFIKRIATLCDAPNLTVELLTD